MQTDMNDQSNERERMLEERLARVEAELQEFVYIASHDLQEPLRKIASFGSRLRDMNADSLDDRSLDYLNRMLDATDRAKDMVQGLLAFSRVVTHGKPFQRVELQCVVERAASQFDARIKALYGHIAIDRLPSIEGDSEQLVQLFGYLFDNAIKFSHEGVPPIVAVVNQADSGDGRVHILIKDNGIGFSPEKKEQIFGLFQKLNGRLFAGAGMGLAIARRIAERHGGQLTADSQIGVGSSFNVILPAFCSSATDADQDK